MLRLVVCLWFLYPSVFLFAQKENYNWVVSHNLRIDFNHTPPLVVHGDLGFRNSFPNLTSISDAAGQLLFYINLSTIYNNKSEEIFTAGRTLYLNNYVAVVPALTKENAFFWVFYEFKPYEKDELILYYIDMNANHGAGMVSERASFTDGHQSDFSIIRKTGANSYYLVLFKEDVVLVYLFDASGTKHLASYKLSTGVYETKVSPDMSKVFCKGKSLSVFDIKNETGELSNFRNLLQGAESYECEFSSNGKYVYVSELLHDAGEVTISQYSMDALANEELFVSSKKVLHRQPANYKNIPADMQLAPDGKIYIACRDEYLWCIENPDLAYPSCAVNTKALQVPDGKFVKYLPNYLIYQPSFSYNSLCNEVSFYAPPSAAKSYLWHFGDGQTSTQTNPDHTYAQPGEYTITLTVTRTDNTTETLTKEITIYPEVNTSAIQFE